MAFLFFVSKKAPKNFGFSSGARNPEPNPEPGLYPVNGSFGPGNRPEILGSRTGRKTQKNPGPLLVSGSNR